MNKSTEVKIYCANCDKDFGTITLPAIALAGGLYLDYWDFTKSKPDLQEHHTFQRCCVYGVYVHATDNKPFTLIMYEGTYTINPNKNPCAYLGQDCPDSQ